MLDVLRKILAAQENSTPIDQYYAVSATQGFFLDFKGRRHLYLFSPSALTLVLPDIGGTLSITANTWNEISYHPGLQIFATSATTTPVLVLVRATDETLDSIQAISGAVTSVDGGIVTLGSKADAAQIDPTQSASIVSLLKGMQTELIDIEAQTTTTPVVTGTKTNNNAAPGSNNVGALVGIANAAAPTYTEGDEVLLSLDLAGNNRTLVSNVNANGQTTASGSSPVVLASDKAITVAGTNGITIVEQSASIAAQAAGTCTLAGAASKTTYIRGFVISAQAAVAVVSGTITVTGLTNTLSFTFDNLVTGQSLLNIFFGEAGIPASATNTGIVVNVPAITGGAAITVAAWGYQL